MAIAPPKKEAVNPKLAMMLSIGSTEAKPITAREDLTLVPLNFKVSPEFKRRLKMYCVENDSTMVEFMMDTLNRVMGE